VRLLYTLALLLLAPIALVALEWRARRQTGVGGGWRARLGVVPVRDDAPLWLHAASVGEVQSLVPLAKSLRRARPHLPLVVTTFTAAGAARARAALGEGIAVWPLPYDVPWSVAAFLRRVRPRGLVVVETELWPNLLAALAERRLPFAVVSARVSERALTRYLGLGALLRRPLQSVGAVLAQSQADAARFQALGVPGAKVSVAGNLKWDLELPPALEADGAELRASLLAGRPLLVAGSTREGEEELVLRAFAAARRSHPSLALVLAPRHPERAPAVEALCEQAGFATVRRSSRRALGEADVLLVDGIGELTLFYAAADVAFVGGSLVPVGGHNLLEPAALGRAVLTGPHHENAPEIVASLRASDAVRVVADATEFAAACDALLRDPSARRALGARARQAVLANRGALAACTSLALGLAGA
jgi:3-deoxy-D-manno-octulosonic-acid transferase